MILFSDIDGTLLDAHRQLSPRTVAVIKLLDKKGIPFIMTSSRSPLQMKSLQRQADIESLPLIAFNGALVVEEGKVLSSEEIPLMLVQELVDFKYETKIKGHISLYNHNEWYASENDYWTQREEHNTKVKAQILSPEKVLERWREQGKGVHKIMIMGDKNYVDIIADFLSKYPELSSYRSKETYLEVTCQSVNKLTGIEFLLKHKYESELDRAIAFGDNYNDIPMLKGVGMGVAVGNARLEVREVARCKLRLSHKEDAVAVFLETHFKEILS